MTVQHRIMSILSTLLVATVCSAPQLSAQQSNPSTAQQPPETSQQPQQPTNTQPAPAAAPAQNTEPAAPANQTQPQQPAPSGTTVNPSQAPLNPVTTYPDASDTQQQPSPNAAPQTTTTIPEGPQPKKPAEPVGAATAESVPTAGGAAAKPAGVAIAPAKQHQTRSLMIKIGAALAAGAALGTVYALSHGTSSTPPGTGLAGVTGR
jgi:DNA mismatch repair ATPase MutL